MLALQQHEDRSSAQLDRLENGGVLLLVDDEVNILAALKRLLRSTPYTLLTANSPEAALHLLAQEPVDVIISDQRMPSMSGCELLRRAQLAQPNAVRLMLTGYTDLQAVFDAINQGAVYKFILKPWDSDLLLATVNEAFLQKKMADAQLQRNTQLLQINRQLSEENKALRLRIAELEQKLADTQQ